MTNKGARFEHTAASVFANNGFSNVQVTRATGDGGIDIAMTQKGHHYAVECKCFSKDNHVGRPIVQKLNTAMVYPTEYKHPFSHGIIVTTSTFSKEAIDYVKQINKAEGYQRIRLIDGVEFNAMKNRIPWYRAILSKISWKVKLLVLLAVTCGIIVHEGWTEQIISMVTDYIKQNI